MSEKSVGAVDRKPMNQSVILKSSSKVIKGAKAKKPLLGMGSGRKFKGHTDRTKKDNGNDSSRILAPRDISKGKGSIKGMSARTAFSNGPQ
jgi:hypothetical protein